MFFKDKNTGKMKTIFQVKESYLPFDGKDAKSWSIIEDDSYCEEDGIYFPLSIIDNEYYIEYTSTENPTTISETLELYANKDTTGAVLKTRLQEINAANTNINIKVSTKYDFIEDMSYMFGYADRWGDALENHYISIDVSGLKTNNAINMDGMFFYCQNLTSLDLSSFVTSKVTSMQDMFCYCNNLTSLNISSFDTSNVTTFKNFLHFCQKLANFSVANIKTDSATDLSSMFQGMNAATTASLSTAANFNTSKVTTFWHTFSGCHALTDGSFVNNWNTSSATNMVSMFQACMGMTNISLSFDTSNVTNMSSMFTACGGLKTMSLNFNTEKVTDMGDMFGGVGASGGMSTLDLSSFKTPLLTDVELMFWGAKNLTTLNLSNMTFTNVTPGDYGMFYTDLDNSDDPMFKRNCKIIVKDTTQQSWIKTNNSELTNVVVA